MMRTILIATDGSEHARLAETKGLELAKSLGAKAVVVRVSGKPAHIVVMGFDLTELPDSVKAEISRQIERHFERIRQQAAALGVACETKRVEAISPSDGILETARAVGAELIVMARHGRRGAAAKLLGSETSHVLVKSTIPVLVVQ